MFACRKNRTTASLLTVFTALIIASGMDVYALQPMPPKDQIPADIVGAMKRDIEKLYSSDALERANAAQRLGKEQALPAVPFLIGMLDDNAKLSTNDLLRPLTTPGGEAARALIMIGKTDVVISALKDKDLDVRINAIRGLESVGKFVIEPLILALKNNDEQTKEIISNILLKMTHRFYGKDYEKWMKWWERNKDSYK